MILMHMIYKLNENKFLMIKKKKNDSRIDVFYLYCYAKVIYFKTNCLLLLSARLRLLDCVY